MEPMDDAEDRYVVATTCNDDRVPLGPLALPEDLVLDDGCCWPDSSNLSEAEHSQEVTFPDWVVDVGSSSEPIPMDPPDADKTDAEDRGVAEASPPVQTSGADQNCGAFEERARDIRATHLVVALGRPVGG